MIVLGFFRKMGEDTLRGLGKSVESGGFLDVVDDGLLDSGIARLRDHQE